MSQLLSDAREFGKSIASTFVITLILSGLLFGAMPLSGTSASELEKIATESIAFRTIQILLPLQVLVSGVVLMLLAVPKLSASHTWFDRWLIRPLAQYAAGICAVALAVILGLGIVVAVTDQPRLGLLLWPIVLLLLITAMSLCVPWMSKPATLEATTIRRRLGWGVFFLIGAAGLCIYAYSPPPEAPECTHRGSAANSSSKPTPLRGAA